MPTRVLGFSVRIIVFFCIWVFMCFFLHEGYCDDPTVTVKASPDYRELKIFRRVMEIIRKDYVREVSDRELIQGAIRGMLTSLDEGSNYLSEESLKTGMEYTKGEHDGVGLKISIPYGILTVDSVIDDTPAFKAGIRPGDQIIQINGVPTKEMTLDKAERQLRCPKGTKVTLTIIREGFRKPRDFSMTAKFVHEKSVKNEIVEPGIGYAKIANLRENTDTELKAAINNLGGDDKIKGLILDLRNNPGGLLDQAVKVSNLFIDKGLIVYTDGRTKDQKMQFIAAPAGVHYKFRMAVLINDRTVSGSEIVAGALQDHDRSLVFGRKSFGRATIQTIIPLDNGSGMRLTTARYFTPKGREIEKVGIQPDVDLKAEIEAEESALSSRGDKSKFSASKADPSSDIALRKALEWLKSGDSVQAYKLKH